MVGPIVRVDFGRDEDGNGVFCIVGERTNALVGFGDVDATIEFGGFVDYQQNAFRISAELCHGINGHEGFIGEIGFDYA